MEDSKQIVAAHEAPASLVDAMESGAAVVVDLSTSGGLMSALAVAAADSRCNVDKIERLWQMHKEIEAKNAERAFNEAMRAAQAEMPKIVKDRHNTQTSSDYATLDAIIGKIAPIYTRHGLSITFDTADSPFAEHIRILATVLHSSGHSRTYTYDQPFDLTGIAGKVNKTLTHARGSAVTYGRRYLTLMVFNLSTGYDDDGNGADKGKQQPQAQPGDTAATKRDDWIAVAEGIQHPAEYEEQRAKMLADYGNVTNKVPRSVATAFAETRARVMPKDEE